VPDGRSATVRRFRDLIEDNSADLGGADRLSEGQRQIIRRCAMLSAEAERMEAMAVRDEASFDANAYGCLSDRLCRLLTRLGFGIETSDRQDLKELANEKLYVHLVQRYVNLAKDRIDPTDTPLQNAEFSKLNP
jgi:hypothetical protein